MGMQTLTNLLCKVGLHNWKIIEGSEYYSKYSEHADFICNWCKADGEGTR